MRVRVWTTALALLACASISASAQSLSSSGVRAVPTYESVGLYWANPGASSAGCDVQFRKVGDIAWRTGLGLVYDAAGAECRGSLVSLTPGTAYEAQLAVAAQAPARSISFTTWANQVPVARTVSVAGGNATLNITEGGSASGYVVYDGGGRPSTVRTSRNTT
jgi:hypothetical protein